MEDTHVPHYIETDVSLAENMYEASVGYFGQVLSCTVDCFAQAINCFLLSLN
jgi:hypothetical protein